MNQDNPYQAGETNRQSPAVMTSSGVEGLVPYKNAPALIGYYMGVFSLIPILGLPFSVAAIILGVIGLKKRKEMPSAKGSAHAIVALVLGTITLLLWGGLILLFMIGISTTSLQP